jgi:hypothetical protein
MAFMLSLAGWPESYDNDDDTIISSKQTLDKMTDEGYPVIISHIRNPK